MFLHIHEHDVAGHSKLSPLTISLVPSTSEGNFLQLFELLWHLEEIHLSNRHLTERVLYLQLSPHVPSSSRLPSSPVLDRSIPISTTPILGLAKPRGSRERDSAVLESTYVAGWACWLS